MDKRISYKIVLDCETTVCDTTVKDVTPTNMLVYDLGWVVTDKKGKVYKTRSFVNTDIFLGESDLMKNAFFSNKIPQYWEELKNGTRKFASFENIRKTLFEDMKEYGITEVYAHNMWFDWGSLDNTLRWLTKSEERRFFPINVIGCDTLKMAKEVIAKTSTYKKFCKDNGYMTKNNQVRLTAEILYRYISNNNDFIESHTGLEDVLIEKEIMKYCFNKHKKMDRVLYK